MAELINETDTLNKGRIKINNAITDAEQAKNISQGADGKATQALANSESTQTQLDTIVIEGDSSIEAAQARVDEKGVGHSTLKERIDDGFTEVTSQLAHTMDKVSDFITFPQSPKPEKSGVKESSHKIVHKISNSQVRIVQKTNEGYVHYDLQKGGNSGVNDYGDNHELLRLYSAKPLNEAYVFFDVSEPKSRNLTIYNAPGIFNSIESELFYLPNLDTTGESHVSSDGALGMGCYVVNPSTEVEYDLPITEFDEANLLIMGTVGSGDDLQVFVAGKLVKTINAKSYVTSDNNTAFATITFKIPSKKGSSNKKFSIKLRNNASTGNNYICALNYFKLKDYKGHPITNYKGFGTNKPGWITRSGASDYALYDQEEGKWFGSYHGGEISLYNRVQWLGQPNISPSHPHAFSPIENIEDGEWRAQSNLQFYQRTSLANGKAEMISIWNFDVDGSMEMDMSYQGNVVLGNFYTALTAADVSFNYLMFPVFMFLGSNPTGNKIYTPLTEGKVSQLSQSQGLQLDTRFTKFNQERATEGPYISDVNAYRKFYYSPINGNKGRFKLPALTFSKGLDFIVR